MRFPRSLFLLLVLSAPLSALDLQVTLAASAAAAPLDGRVIVILSKEMNGEPRAQVGWGIDTAQIFGVDVNGWNAGDIARFEGNVFGNPLRSLRDIPPGTYNVQAVLNVYETFHRSDGHVVKLHMDHGEGQQWNRSPGNLYSKPKRVEIAADTSVAIELTEVIPPIAPPKDTKYVRHVSIESQLLTKFWGRPMRIGAVVLVPDGFDDHPQQRYPVAYMQGHFPADFGRFNETPPTAAMKGGERRAAEAGYQLYQEWTSGRLPKMLVVLTQHPTPYYDDSYGVNTANAGPYGDALTQEVYPAVEKEFRGIGESWARVVFGGSTGGGVTLAQQIFYPEHFGGGWGVLPDP